jgi:hypothetical protein
LCLSIIPSILLFLNFIKLSKAWTENSLSWTFLQTISKPATPSSKPILSSPPPLQSKPNDPGLISQKCSKENHPLRAFKEKKKNVKAQTPK